MDNAKRSTLPEPAPDWFVETVRVTQRVYGSVRNIELELRGVLELKGLDARIRGEAELVLESLAMLQGSLALLDMAVGEVVGSVAHRRSRNGTRNGAATTA